MFFFFFISVPKDLQELVIPNPVNETNKMYNNILFELYKSSYDLMSPLQFKNCVVSQRLLRKKFNDKLKKVNNEFQDLINGGKSGNSYNVIKYTSDDSMFVAKRCLTSRKYIESAYRFAK